MRKFTLIAVLIFAVQIGMAQDMDLSVKWDKTTMVSKSTATLQVVGNPMLRRGASMHDGSFGALKDLGADYVRYVPWFPYPKLAVAELEPPTASTTSWDFSLIDPMTIDFLEATKGHSIIMNFSTIPQWMFKTDKKVTYPADPNEVGWGYGGGTQFRDPTMKELTGYYERLISWYTKGGFTDELGKYHKSGYQYEFQYWEVLNEPDLEHNFTPEMYTKVYDAMYTAIHKVSPKTKIVGLGLAYEKPYWFEYFLNPKHHKPGIPLEVISYHCYANANDGQKFDAYEYTLFDKADLFLEKVGFIESVRKRLSPKTKTDINELGTFVSNAMRAQPITQEYWNLSASVYAYFFIDLTRQGIDYIGESQLVGFPTQYPDVSMINYTNSKPNARFWVLKLIKDNIHAGDKLVETGIGNNGNGDVHAQGFVSSAGSKKVLVLNKRNKTITIKLPAGFAGAKVSTIDAASGDNAAIESTVKGDTIELKPFAVSLVVLEK
ncbi:glycosyl hydrolase family 39 [Mucilaginibacter flavidus]|uniref:glycosyl hydrolase family 39 n=1 Tax=Mucilaginibacter flavidus TaxID=2949309 RepID=UPI0020920FFF|nr:glycosyl hydrolase family 39 [Mucilaginibacter flavidus]MCO5947099.1 glycosyl hydrolase family 39 [Mucilaginibacter flavidus]